VREAIHRLKEYELVRVRQGSPTVVLDPDEATDIRLLGLEIELMPGDSGGTQALAERQVYAGAAVLDLAEQRMTKEEVDELERLVDDFLSVADKAAATIAFERAYWTAIARGSRNRIYLRETTWFFNLLGRDERFRRALLGAPEDRAGTYKALIESLRSRRGSADLYLRALRAAGRSSA
jgi:DNA-binding FadR family transcriptional regulator